MSQRRSFISWPIALVLVAAIIAATALFIIHELTSSAGEVIDKGAGAAERVVGIITGIWNVQPEILYDDSVIVEKGEGASKLVVVEHPVEVRREMNHEFLRSTKRLRVEGKFKALAGFDLEKPFQIEVIDNIVQITLPEPEIIAIESDQLEISEMRNGLWNKLTPEEVEQAMNELPDLARDKVTSLNILDEAVADFGRQIQERLGAGWEVEVKTAVSVQTFIED